MPSNSEINREKNGENIQMLRLYVKHKLNDISYLGSTENSGGQPGVAKENFSDASNKMCQYNVKVERCDEFRDFMVAFSNRLYLRLWTKNGRAALFGPITK